MEFNVDLFQFSYPHMTADAQSCTILVLDNVLHDETYGCSDFENGDVGVSVTIMEYTV